MSEPLRALAPDLWCADRALGLRGVPEVGARMVVIRLRDGGLFVHSPIRFDDPTKRALDALGPVRALVAPNKVHSSFIAPWAEAYPQARCFAAPGLRAKRPRLRFEEELGDEAPALWRGEIEQHWVKGMSFMNEVAFFHLASRTLLLTDLAFHFAAPPRGRGFATSFFFLVTGAGHGFGPHRLVRSTMLRRGMLRASRDRILEWPTERVTVTHGEVLERGGRDALRRAFNFLG